MNENTSRARRIQIALTLFILLLVIGALAYRMLHKTPSTATPHEELSEQQVLNRLTAPPGTPEDEKRLQELLKRFNAPKK